MWDKLMLMLNNEDLSFELKLEVKMFLHMLSLPGGIYSVGHRVEAFLEKHKELFTDEKNQD